MTCWYIDIENVRSRFVWLVDEMAQHDHLFLFYTNKEERLPIVCWQSVYRAIVHPHFICVEPTGPNAVDFAIMVEMGRQSLLHPGCEHRCVTDDKGFEGGLAHLQSYGVKCSRVPCPQRLDSEEQAIVSSTCGIGGDAERKQEIHTLCMRAYGSLEAGEHFRRIKQHLIQRGELRA